MIKSKDFKLQFYFDFNLRIQKIRNCSIFNLKKVLILISFDFDFDFYFYFNFYFVIYLPLFGSAGDRLK